VAALCTIASSRETDTASEIEKAPQKKQADQGIRDKKQKEHDDQQKTDMDKIRKDSEEMHQRWRRDSGC
jgi:hypothetical protein